MAVGERIERPLGFPEKLTVFCLPNRLTNIVVRLFTWKSETIQLLTGREGHLR